MSALVIRAAGHSDIAAIHAIHAASIHGLCSSSYPAETISAWSSNPDVERFARHMEAGIKYLLAVQHGTACGFAALDVVNAKVTALFVHPEHAGKGIGMHLLLELERMATIHGLLELQVDSSLNARRFYQKHGYGDAKPEKYRLSTGIEIDAMHLKKSLTR